MKNALFTALKGNSIVGWLCMFLFAQGAVLGGDSAGLYLGCEYLCLNIHLEKPVLSQLAGGK